MKLTKNDNIFYILLITILSVSIIIKYMCMYDGKCVEIDLKCSQNKIEKSLKKNNKNSNHGSSF